MQFNRSGYPRNHTPAIKHIIRAIVFVAFVSIPIMGAVAWAKWWLHAVGLI